MATQPNGNGPYSPYSINPGRTPGNSKYFYEEAGVAPRPSVADDYVPEVHSEGSTPPEPTVVTLNAETLAAASAQAQNNKGKAPAPPQVDTRPANNEDDKYDYDLSSYTMSPMSTARKMKSPTGSFRGLVRALSPKTSGASLKGKSRAPESGVRGAAEIPSPTGRFRSGPTSPHAQVLSPKGKGKDKVEGNTLTLSANNLSAGGAASARPKSKRNVSINPGTAEPMAGLAVPKDLVNIDAACQRCKKGFGAGDARQLTCGHSFCEPCLKELLDHGKIKCSMCEETTEVKNDDINELPRNYTLSNARALNRRKSSFVRSTASCPICFEMYDNDHIPRLLRCGHTFCEQCLAHCISDDVIKCPNKCHVTTPLDTSDPSNVGVPVNRGLLSVLDDYASVFGFGGGFNVPKDAPYLKKVLAARPKGPPAAAPGTGRGGGVLQQQTLANRAQNQQQAQRRQQQVSREEQYREYAEAARRYVNGPNGARQGYDSVNPEEGYTAPPAPLDSTTEMELTAGFAVQTHGPIFKIINLCALIITFAVAIYAIVLFVIYNPKYCESPLAPWCLAFGIWIFVSRGMFVCAHCLYVKDHPVASQRLRTFNRVLGILSIVLYIVGAVLCFKMSWTDYVCPSVLVFSLRVFFAAYFILLGVQLVLFCLAVIGENR